MSVLRIRPVEGVPPPGAGPAHSPEVTRMLAAEHRLILDELEALGDHLSRRPARERRVAVRALVRRITVHETVEACCLYPVLAGYEGGAKLRARAEADERALMVELVALERRAWLWPRRRSLGRQIDALAGRLAGHFALEEDHVLPSIVRFESLDKRRMMGTWAERVGRLAPTRPHPHAPRRLPGQFGLMATLGVLDRARDRIARWI